MEPPKGRGGRQESSRGRVEDGRVSLAETEEESSVDTGESEDVPSTVERGGSGQEDDSGSGLEEVGVILWRAVMEFVQGTPMADPLLHGTARAETDSVADRVVQFRGARSRLWCLRLPLTLDYLCISSTHTVSVVTISNVSPFLMRLDSYEGFLYNPLCM